MELIVLFGPEGWGKLQNAAVAEKQEVMQTVPRMANLFKEFLSNY